MSVGYPSLIAQPAGLAKLTTTNDQYPVPDRMLHGFGSAKNQTMISHPLEYAEAHYHANREELDFSMLRNTQGLHAPLKLRMERLTTAKVERLPCLKSSHLMQDILTGRLDTIDVDDVFNSESEVAGQPHLLMEKRRHLL